VKSQTSFLTVQDGLYSLSRHSRATKLCYWGLRVFSQDKAWMRGIQYFGVRSFVLLCKFSYDPIPTKTPSSYVRTAYVHPMWN